MQYKSPSGTQEIDKAKHFKIPHTAYKSNESQLKVWIGEGSEKFVSHWNCLFAWRETLF